MEQAAKKAQPLRLAEGDRVTTTWDHDRPGKIVTLGVEVSTVKFDDGRERHVPNEQLRRAK